MGPVVEPIEPATATVSRRLPIEPRTVAFVPSSATVADCLATGARHVMVTGARPGGTWAGWGEWITAPAGWQLDPASHVAGASPQLLYLGPGGERVTVSRAEAWGLPDDPAACHRAWRLLGAVLRGIGGQLLATPSATGRDLWLRLIEPGTRWPVLPDEWQDTIRSTAPQARLEIVAPGTYPVVRGLDMRWAYAALCSELPGGRAEHHRGPGLDIGTHTRCRVLAEWQPPEGWRPDIGLLPVVDQRGWSWPTSREWQRGWIDGSELALARRWGWTVNVTEAIVWPDRARPLDRWARALREARARISRGPRADQQTVARALRFVLLHTIGALQGRPRIEARLGAADDRAVIMMGDQMAHERRAADARWKATAHPELSAAIWARCRCRLLDGPGNSGALHLPVGSVVAFRTDAIYTTELVQWPDDGQPGRYRLKGDRYDIEIRNHRNIIEGWADNG